MTEIRKEEQVQRRSVSEPGNTRLSRRRLAHAFTRLGRSNVIYIFSALVLLYLTFAVLSPPSTFLTTFNMQSILADSSFILLVAAGATVVMISGGLDMSQGSVAAFAGVAAVESMRRLSEHGVSSTPTIVVGICVGIASGALWGAINGILITALRLPSFIVTLGSFGTALGVARLITSGNTASGVPTELVTSVGLGVWFGMPAPFVIAAACALLVGFMLKYTRSGEYTYLVGSNEEAARRAGINVNRQLLRVYVLSGALSGLAGVIDAARFSGASVTTGHVTELVAAIAAVVIGGASLAGGVGLMLGTVIGVFYPTVLNNGLTILQVQRFWQEVAVGIILVAAVAFDQWRRQREIHT